MIWLNSAVGTSNYISIIKKVFHSIAMITINYYLLYSRIRSINDSILIKK